jgi:hypothetical protein
MSVRARPGDSKPHATPGGHGGAIPRSRPARWTSITGSRGPPPGTICLALLRDEVERSVVVRRFSNGSADLLTTFDVKRPPECANAALVTPVFA